MEEIIKTSQLYYQEQKQLESYYGKLPVFFLYRLNSINDLYKIDNQDFVRHMQNKYKHDIERGISFYHRYRRKNIIVLINDEDVFHEMSHLLFKDQLDEIFTEEQWNVRNFIDEIIAEYNSTRIMGCSKFLAEIKRGKNISNKNLPYHIGVAFAMYNNLGNGSYEKHLKHLVDKIRQNLEFDEKEILCINKEAIVAMFKKKKTEG